jgi:hypothetical protein
MFSKNIKSIRNIHFITNKSIKHTFFSTLNTADVAGNATSTLNETKKNRKTILLDLDKHYEQPSANIVGDIDLGPLPDNVSHEFYLKYKKVLSKFSKRVDYKELMSLITLKKTAQEHSLFLELLEKYNRKSQFTPKKTSVLFSLLDVHSQLELLSNKYSFPLSPSKTHFDKLFLQFTKLSIQDSKELQNLYKIFACCLYYDIPPTLEYYDYLISAGILSGSADGIKYSRMAYEELLSLCWSPLPSTVCTLAYASVLEGCFENALTLLEPLSVSYETLCVKIHAFIKMKNYQDALESLKELSLKEMPLFDYPKVYLNSVEEFRSIFLKAEGVTDEHLSLLKEIKL